MIDLMTAKLEPNPDGNIADILADNGHGYEYTGYYLWTDVWGKLNLSRDGEEDKAV